MGRGPCCNAGLFERINYLLSFRHFAQRSFAASPTRFRPASELASLQDIVLVIEAAGENSLRMTIQNERTGINRTEVRPTDGKEHKEERWPDVTSVCTMVDDHHMHVIVLKDGKPLQITEIRYSVDGMTRTSTRKGTRVGGGDLPQPYIAVYDRQ